MSEKLPSPDDVLGKETTSTLPSPKDILGDDIPLSDVQKIVDGSKHLFDPSVPTNYIKPSRLLEMEKTGEKVPDVKEDLNPIQKISSALSGNEKQLKEMNEHWWSKPIAAEIGAYHGIKSGLKKMSEAADELSPLPHVNASGRNPLESGIHMISGATESAFGTAMLVTPAGQVINISTSELPDEAKKVLFSPVTKAFEMIKGGKAPYQIFEDTSEESPKSETGKEFLGILDAAAAVLAGGNVDEGVRDAAKKILNRTAKESDYKTIIDNQGNVTGGDIKKSSDLINQLKDVPQKKQNEIISLSSDHDNAIKKAEQSPDALKKAFEDKAKDIKQKISDVINVPEMPEGGSGVPDKTEGTQEKKVSEETTPEAVKEGNTNKLFSEPAPEIKGVVDNYKKEKGITTPSGEPINSIDVENSKKIADEFEKMQHNPEDPETKSAYQAMADETISQHKALTDAGYKFELYEGKGEPYKSSEEMLKDLRENKHLFVLPTEKEFGTEPITDEQRKQNPLLHDSGIKDVNGKTMLVNDVFRGVHDAIGHGERGNSFGAKGEENAWDVHARMYSPLARRAMTTETRGQNSWVNFGKHLRDETGNVKDIGAKEKPYAEQKIGLMSEWTSQLPEEKAKPEATQEGETIKPNESKEEKGDETKAEEKNVLKEGGDNTVGISHEALNKLAKNLGLPEIKRGTVMTPKQYADMGREILKSGVDPNTILDSGLKPSEMASVSRAYLEELKKQADAIKDKSSDEYKNIESKIGDYEKNVAKVLGTEWAATGMALQGERDLATDSFYEAKKTLEKSLDGKEPTKEQLAELQKKTEENQSLKKVIEDLEQKIKDATDKELGDKNFVDNVDKKSTETRRQYRIKKVDKFFDDAIASLSKKGVAYATIIPPDVIKIALKGMKEAYHAGEGISKIVEDAVKYISSKVGDWDKEKFTKEYTDALSKITKDSPEQKLLDRKTKQRDDLLAGKENKKNPKEYNLSDEEKAKLDDLSQEIKDIKLSKITKDLQSKFSNKKGNIFTADESKSLWNYGKEKYLNNGVSYDDMIQYVSGDMGITPEQLRHAIVTPKTNPISIERWKKMSELRKSRNATQRYIDDQSNSPLLRQARKVSGDIRDVATFGHGHVFLGTHAGLTAFSNPKLWTEAYKKGVGLSYAMSDAEVEQFAHDFKNRPLWAVFNKAGLQNDLFKMGNDTELAQESHLVDMARSLHSKGGTTGKLGKFLVAGSESGRKGFMAIKWLRQELAEQAYNKLTEEQKSNPRVLESVARLMNNATGATNVKLSGGVNEVIKEGLFAGGMEISRWEKILKNPTVAMSTLSKIPFEKIGWIKELPEHEKVFATIWAKRVMTQAIVYGGLVAISKAIFHKDDETPLESIKNSVGKSDMLKVNIGKHGVIDPTSGMASSIGLLGKIYNALPNEDNANSGKVGETLAQYGRGKLAPTYQGVAEVLTGHDVAGNTVPFRDVPPEHDYNRELSTGEYLESKAPIPFAEGFQAANEAHNVASGLASGLISGTLGIKSYIKEEEKSDIEKKIDKALNAISGKKQEKRINKLLEKLKK